MSSEFYTTKMVIEVEVQHYGHITNALDMVRSRLTGPDIRAVVSVDVLSAESNYRLHQTPAMELAPIDLDNIPK